MDTWFYGGTSKALQDPRDWKTPGVCEGLRKKLVERSRPGVPGSQAERQNMQLETEHRTPWLFAWLLDTFSCSEGPLPLLDSVCGTSVPAESLDCGTPATSFPIPRDTSLGSSRWLARYLRDLHLLGEPQPASRALQVPAPCLRSMECRTTPRPLGPLDPGPAPPPWPRRSVPGGGTARSSVS